MLAYDRQQKQPKYPTTVQAVWSDDGVTFGFRMTEPAANKLKKSRTGHDNSMLWWDDNIELLLDPSGKGDGDYYHFIISAGAVVADGQARDFSWNCPGLKTAVDVQTSAWTMEVFAPYAAFPDAIKPSTGSKVSWTGNFTRHRIADSSDADKTPGSEPEYQRLNTTYETPSANLADFGPIEFVN